MSLWILPALVMALYVILPTTSPANSLCIYVNDHVFKYRQLTQNKGTSKSKWFHWCVLKQEALQEADTFGSKTCIYLVLTDK